MLESGLYKLENHIDFSYSCFDRVVLRGYLPNLFVEGSVVSLLRNFGFKKHTNGVLKIFTDQFNQHIKKVSEVLGITIHWWGSAEKEKHHSKLDLVKDIYHKEIQQKTKSDKVICIIKSLENKRTFAIKEIKTKAGKFFTKIRLEAEFLLKLSEEENMIIIIK